MKHLRDFNSFNESIKIPIRKGDVIYGGRFKNRKTVVKKISEDEHGEPLVNDKPLLKYKLKKDKKADS